MFVSFIQPGMTMLIYPGLHLEMEVTVTPGSHISHLAIHDGIPSRIVHIHAP